MRAWREGSGTQDMGPQRVSLFRRVSSTASSGSVGSDDSCMCKTILHVVRDRGGGGGSEACQGQQYRDVSSATKALDV